MGIARNHFDPEKSPRGRVELHLHLDGSIRTSTIWELAKQKGIKIGTGSYGDVESAVKVVHPSTLANFLSKFRIFMPTVVGDPEAIERIAYELCEDQANEGVAYFEARYSAQCLSNTNGFGENLSKSDPKAVTPEMVVELVSKGLEKGQKDFGIKARSILCCLTSKPEWSEETLQLCKDYRDRGVVAIDVAGDESICEGAIEHFCPTEIAVFKKAKAAGIHRTCHAGEAGPPDNIRVALEEMFAERIGHGYHVVEDQDLYDECLANRVHFECCPYSSILTGAVPSTYNSGKHPIVQLAEDNFNFSINKDDSTLTQTTLDDEYRFLSRLGLNEVHFVKANLNAAKASFLPQKEKKELIAQLLKVYGVSDLGL